MQDNEPCADPIVESVVERMRERSRLGVAKYGSTLFDDRANLGDWFNHIQEELMDAVLYIERASSEMRALEEMRRWE
jgi:hypothetical protein